MAVPLAESGIPIYIHGLYPLQSPGGWEDLKPHSLCGLRRHSRQLQRYPGNHRGGADEASKFWLWVLNDLHDRGVEDVLFFCVDGLPGFNHTGCIPQGGDTALCHPHAAQFLQICQI